MALSKTAIPLFAEQPTPNLPTVEQLGFIQELEKHNRAKFLETMTKFGTPWVTGIHYHGQSQRGVHTFHVVHHAWKSSTQASLDSMTTHFSTLLCSRVELVLLNEENTLRFFWGMYGPPVDVLQRRFPRLPKGSNLLQTVLADKEAVLEAMVDYMGSSMESYLEALEDGGQIIPGAMVEQMRDGSFQLRLCWLPDQLCKYRWRNICACKLEDLLGGPVIITRLGIEDTIKVFEEKYPNAFQIYSLAIMNGRYMFSLMPKQVQAILQGKPHLPDSALHPKMLAGPRLPSVTVSEAAGVDVKPPLVSMQSICREDSCVGKSPLSFMDDDGREAPSALEEESKDGHAPQEYIPAHLSCPRKMDLF